MNLHTEEEVKQAFKIASQYSSEILIEKMCVGNDYRVLVVNHKFVAASERIPPFVIGDGASTIQQLIDIMNQDPRRGEGHSTASISISLNADALDDCLEQLL